MAGGQPRVGREALKHGQVVYCTPSHASFKLGVWAYLTVHDVWELKCQGFGAVVVGIAEADQLNGMGCLRLLRRPRESQGELMAAVCHRGVDANHTVATLNSGRQRASRFGGCWQEHAQTNTALHVPRTGYAWQTQHCETC